MTCIAENLRLFLEAEPPISMPEEIAILRFYAPSVGAWIDRNRVSGSEDNRGIVRSLLALYTRKADWTMLDKNRASEDLRGITARLKRLL